MKWTHTIVCAAAAFATATVAGRPDESLDARRRDLHARITVEKAKLERWMRPGAAPVATPSLRETYIALAELHELRAADYLTGGYSSPGAASNVVALAEKLVEVTTPGGPARVTLPNGLFEHAYFARNDFSAQPYWVACPAAPPAGQRRPLVVFLHGWVPDTSRTNPWYPIDSLAELCRSRGVFLVAPHGRTNTDFQFVGEVDVLRVIAEMLKFYPVDPDRVYLTGVSMGGAGAWQIALHYPDLFAGVAPVSAQTDWFRFWHEFFRYPARSELPRHVEWIMAMHSPQELAQNAQCLYSYSQQSPNCFLGIAHGQGMADKLSALGIEHKFQMDPDPDQYGHHMYFKAKCWERVLEELLPRKRQRMPDRFRYRSYSLRFPGAYWARAWEVLEWGRPMSFDGRREADGTLSLKTENVKSVRLTPPAEWAGTNGTFRIAWNGAVRTNFALGPLGSAFMRLPGTKAGTGFPSAKSTGVCGPASDVFNYPFLVVVGTAGTAEETEANSRLAAQFTSDWNGYAEGRTRSIRDSDLTPRDEARYGLVLVGLPENNSALGRIADKLPLELSRKGVTFPDGKVIEQDGLGVLLTYPNPRAPYRYVLVYSGVPWGQGRSKNHRFDLIPDFAVYTDETIPGLGINRFLAAGLFDENWAYDEDLTDFGTSDADQDAGPEPADE